VVRKKANNIFELFTKQKADNLSSWH
jgi:hypothetical protein